MVPSLIEGRCPTFSWTAVTGATGYELIVYDSEPDASGEPVLARSFPGSAFSWTPSTESCFGRGRVYAWSVRASGPSVSEEWSELRLFEVTSRPSEEEFAAAVELVRVYLAAAQAPSAGTPGVVPPPTARPTQGAVSQGGVAPATALGDSAALTVEGEIRAISSAGFPRSWGRGRPGAEVYLEKGLILPALCENGSIKFGLTNTLVDWGSAADSCPEGSWVCTAIERGTGACTTLSPTEHAYGCDGSYWDIGPAGSRPGWLADTSVSAVGDGQYATEGGSSSNEDTCVNLPVWCCME